METEDQTLVQDCTPENLDPSPVQDEYAPVIFSQETVSHIVSIDMMSGKVVLISIPQLFKIVFLTCLDKIHHRLLQFVSNLTLVVFRFLMNIYI